MKVKPGPPLPIHHYREKKLETTIVCSNCTLRYAVYGAFAFCPDCRQHNSHQILETNLEVVRKMLDLAQSQDGDLEVMLIQNALEDCVSAFDAFGRELCRVHADRTSNPAGMSRMRFQNMVQARSELQAIGVEMRSTITTDAWEQALMLFQKRHLIAHKLGVADQEYVKPEWGPRRSAWAKGSSHHERGDGTPEIALVHGGKPDDAVRRPDRRAVRKEVRQLRRKAVNSLVLSIEHFNRPWDRGRTEAVLILLDHAFEMLLKAAIRHRQGKIRKPSEKQTIGFGACVRKALAQQGAERAAEPLRAAMAAARFSWSGTARGSPATPCSPVKQLRSRAGKRRHGRNETGQWGTARHLRDQGTTAANTGAIP